MRVFTRLNTFLDRIWPPEPANRTRLDLVALALAGGLALGWLLRDAPLLGYDWLTMFHANTATDVYYPPWTSIVLWPLAELPWRLGLALINGITIAAVAVSTYHQGVLDKNPWRIPATLLAVLTLQVAIVLWLGHIDGLALLAILGLPWLAPVVSMKATFVGFGVFARKSWFITALVFGGLSLLLWPGWPATLASTLDFRNTHPSAAGWAVTGWLPAALGVLMLAHSRRTDWLQITAAGSLLYPFLLPYHSLVLLPAFGALRGLRLITAWLAAWLMLIPVALNDHYWLYFMLPAWLWFWRYRQNGLKLSWLTLLQGRG